MKIFSKLLYLVCTLIWLHNFIDYMVTGITPYKFNIGLSFFITTLFFFNGFIGIYKKVN